MHKRSDRKSPLHLIKNDNPEESGDDFIQQLEALQKDMLDIVKGIDDHVAKENMESRFPFDESE